MDESILNRDMNCHPIRLETIQDKITPLICASIKSIPRWPLFNRHAIGRNHSVVITLESDCSKIIVQFIKTDSDIQPRHEPLFSISFFLSLSFIMRAPSHKQTFLSPFHFRTLCKFCLSVCGADVEQRVCNGLPRNDSGFDSRWERCKNRDRQTRVFLYLFCTTIIKYTFLDILKASIS